MKEIPKRLVAALADRYAIERELGAGGMATVYLARDLKHDRQVAIKVLRPELAAVIGGERFVAEIKTTAALQHPNILPLFDSGEADTFLYYVMPYVEGESLRDRLDREGQLPVEEAVRLARAVGSALHYAHERGIVHRDIKPANILVQAGQPVVADFGIAVAISAAGGGRLTETGMSVGTPHYMSPEQASADRDLDARSDSYALACVLYEMLAGQPPHTGPTAQAILMRILTESPRPVTDVRKSVPPHVSAALTKALEKLPADRFPDAQAFVDALDDTGFSYLPATVNQTLEAIPIQSVGVRRGLPSWLAPGALVAGIGIGGLLFSGGESGTEAAPGPPTRVSFSIGDVIPEPPEYLHVSPDGGRFALIGDIDPVDGIYVRTSAETDFRHLVGTNSATFMDFSPDGERIAFTTLENSIVEIPADGGQPRTLLPGDNRGAPLLWLTWDRSGDLLFSRPQGGGTGMTNLYRLPGSGGQPETLLEYSGSLIVHPTLLPGGEHVMFSTATSRALELHDLSSRAQTLLVPDVIWADVLPTGEIIYVDATGTLWGAPFDVDAESFEYDPVPLMDEIAADSRGISGLISVSDVGTLAYMRGDGAVDSGSNQQYLEIVRFDGTREEVGIRDRRYRNVRWSPDGNSLAFAALEPGESGGETSIYTYNVALETATQRLTSEGTQAFPVWSPDGTSIAYTQANQAMGPDNQAVGSILFSDIWTVAADGSGAARLATRPGQDVPYAWGPDGVVFTGGEDNGSSDIVFGEPGSTPPQVFLDIDGDLGSVTLSPDGRYAAFLSSEGVGVAERIEVRTFPNPGPPIVISPDGGDRPRWSADGSRIFYWKEGLGVDSLFATRVRPGPDFQVGDTEFVFAVDERYSIRTWDLHPDGDRMVIARRAVGDDEEDAALPENEYFVVVNWFSELRQALAGAGR